MRGRARPVTLMVPRQQDTGRPREEGRAVGVDTGPGVGHPGAAGGGVVV